MTAAEFVAVVVAEPVAVALLVALAELVAVADAVSVGCTEGEGGADAVGVTDGDTCHCVWPAVWKIVGAVGGREAIIVSIGTGTASCASEIVLRV